MEERKIGLIPHAVVQGALGPKNYGILLTNERSIFVLEDSSKAMLGGIIGGAIGAMVAELAKSRREIDYLHEPIEMLASMKGSISIPHASLSSIFIKGRFSMYSLRIDYSTRVAGGKSRHRWSPRVANGAKEGSEWESERGSKGIR